MPLGAVMQRRRSEVDDTQDVADIPIIEKISFGGTISITEPEDRTGYKGRLFWAESGDLIYSKIRVKQGSLSIIPVEIERIAVSAEYPVYAIQTGQIVPEYLELVLRTKTFLQFLDGLAHGGSTKTRIPPEDFERLEIPVPPLDTQRAIVARWQAAQVEADAAEARVRQMETDLLRGVREALGRNHGLGITPRKAFVISWAALERWGVAMAGRAKTALRNPCIQRLRLGKSARSAVEARPRAKIRPTSAARYPGSKQRRCAARLSMKLKKR